MPEPECIPADVLARLEAFRVEHKAGRVVLDINDGRVVGWEFTEKGRVRREMSA